MIATFLDIAYGSFKANVGSKNGVGEAGYGRRRAKSFVFELNAKEAFAFPKAIQF